MPTRDKALSPGELRIDQSAGTERALVWVCAAVVGAYAYPERGYTAEVNAATLGDPAALDSLIGKPATLRHAEKDITPDTWREVAIGTVLEAKFQGEDLLCLISVNDRRGLDRLAGPRPIYVSPGYVHGDGPATMPGCDKAQTDRRYFELAILAPDERPRGGDRCQVLIDTRSTDAQPADAFDGARALVDAHAPGAEEAQKQTAVEAILAALQTARIKPPAQEPPVAEAPNPETEAALKAANEKIIALEGQIAAMTGEMDKLRMDAEAAAAAPAIAAAADALGVTKTGDAVKDAEAVALKRGSAAKARDAIAEARIYGEAVQKTRDAYPKRQTLNGFETDAERAARDAAAKTTDSTDAKSDY